MTHFDQKMTKNDSFWAFLTGPRLIFLQGSGVNGDFSGISRISFLMVLGSNDLSVGRPGAQK